MLGEKEGEEEEEDKEEENKEEVEEEEVQSKGGRPAVLGCFLYNRSV